MPRAGPESEPVSPQMRRRLSLAWVLIVLTVVACIFLGVWWSHSRPYRNAEAGVPTAAFTPFQTPTLPPQVTEAVPTGAPGMPATPPRAAQEMPTPTPLPVADRSFGYGVQVQALARSGLALEQAQQLGMGWVKQPVRWADVEPSPGSLDWQSLDETFAATSARGLRVLVSISAAPNWARSVTARNFDGPPDDPQAMVRFVTQLIQRYPDAIHAVEVWDEMNRESEWYVPGGLNAAGYMDLLIPVAQAVRALDPGIIIISGGLNPTGIDDGVVAIDDFRYMRALIDAGLLDVVDCVGVHHKGYNLAPNVPYDSGVDNPAARFREPFDNPHHSWSFYSTLRGYHDMIVAVGRGTPLCVTEFGWASAEGLLRSGAPVFVDDNTAAQQGEYIVQAFEFMAGSGFVWMAFLSNLDYSPEEGGGPADNLTIYYRIVLPDGTPRPAFEMLLAMPKRP